MKIIVIKVNCSIVASRDDETMNVKFSVPPFFPQI